jgi:hypothetical protein
VWWTRDECIRPCGWRRQSTLAFETIASLATRFTCSPFDRRRLSSRGRNAMLEKGDRRTPHALPTIVCVQTFISFPPKKRGFIRASCWRRKLKTNRATLGPLRSNSRSTSSTTSSAR